MLVGSIMACFATIFSMVVIPSVIKEYLSTKDIYYGKKYFTDSCFRDLEQYEEP